MRSFLIAFAVLGLSSPSIALAQEPSRFRADAPVRAGALPIAAIQADMVLEIEGIPQPIEVRSWSWGVTQTGAARARAGGGAGRPQFEDLQVTKEVDATSPQLLVDTASGRHFPSASLTVRTTGGGSLRYTLSDVLISGLTVDGSTGVPLETVSLTYQRIEIEHRSSGQAGSVKAGWDLKANRKI